ncbi:MAG: hypothetical protein CML24_02070 [Rhizobiales bacterium]|nr:hypothetical protein [Hyphomicrobiales bacterium]|tara:strand:+ start:2020 stop:2574 length:555 start_codon:yes stop_codon:yes gene_type:complete
MGAAEIIAVVALVISGFAAFFAWRTSTEAKRQADAVLGDLPPIISLYQIPTDQYAAFAEIAVEITNHNRRPLYIARWSFDFPDDLYVFQHHDDQREGIAAIIGAIIDGKRDFVFDLPLRMPSAIPQMPPPKETATFNLSGQQSKRPTAPFDVSMTVWYRIDGDDDLTAETRRMTWVPPKGDHVE